MTISDARALLGPVPTRIIDHAPERDAAALQALARWAVRFSPRVALDPPQGDGAGLLLDVTGCARVHGGEQRLLERLTSSLQRLDISARAAIAPTFGCAWGVARFGEAGAIVPEGGVRQALGDLPTAALRIDDKAIAGLAEVGVERIGELLALPRSALRPRFGPELSQRIAQALGEAIETIEPVRPAPPMRAERLFDGPTSRWEAIAMVARDLVDDLCVQLGARERGAMRLQLTLDRSDTDPVTLDIQLAGPNRDRRHLWSLLRPKLERANMGFGVERMELAAPRSARIAHRQGVCCNGRWRADGAEAQQRQRQEAELIDALSSRLGVDRVLRAQMIESHIPERACQMAPALRTESRARGGQRGAAPVVTCGDRPTVLLARPEPAQVITVAPDGPVLSVTWRGETLRIATSIGPERIEAEWWRHTTGAPAPARDYFKLQDARGRWLWLFRQGSQRQNAEVAEGAQRGAEIIVSEYTARGEGSPNAQASGGCAPEPSSTFERGNAYTQAAPMAPPSHSPGHRPGFEGRQQSSPDRAAQLAFPGALQEAPRSLKGESDRDGLTRVTSASGDPRRDLGGTVGMGTGWFIHGMWV